MSFSLLIESALSISSATGSAKEPSYVIQLPSRHFTPEPGIESTLKERLAKGQIFPVHGLVQLIRKPTTTDRVALSQAGIKLMQYLGGSSYYAEFSRDTRFDEVTPLIRWAGSLLIRDKLENDLWEGKIKDWARAENGNVKVMVYFYKIVDQDYAKKVISSYTKVYRPHRPSNAWAIEIALEHVRKLVSEENVRWIEQGPHPFMPLR